VDGATVMHQHTSNDGVETKRELLRSIGHRRVGIEEVKETLCVWTPISHCGRE
jgi:hypothetical protein